MSRIGRVASLPSPLLSRVAIGLSIAVASIALGRRAVADDVASVDLRMELVKADGKTEPILIDSVTSVHLVPRDGDLRNPAKSLPVANWDSNGVVVSTKDPRAAVARVLVMRPRPVPAEFVVRVPAAHDPRVREVTVEVVDRAAGTPLVDAVIEYAEAAPPVLSQKADATGRIVVGPAGAESGFVRMLRRGAWVHAPGHFGWQRQRAPEDPPIAAVDEIERQLAGRPLRVELEPYPADAKVEERSVRVLSADGTPAVGATVVVAYAVVSLGLGEMAPTQQAHTVRRVGEDGIVRFPVFPKAQVPCLALEASVPAPGLVMGGVPFQGFGLALDALPADKPRDLTLPAIAVVTLAVSGLPADDNVEVGADRFGDARTQVDGPVAPLVNDRGVAEAFASAEKRLAAEATEGPHGKVRAFFPAFKLDPRGVLRPGGLPYRRPLAVGRTTTLWLDRVHVDAATHERDVIETRRLDAQPDEAGPVFVARRWDDLPVEPRER